MTSSDPGISPLRRRMLEDLRMRKGELATGNSRIQSQRVERWLWPRPHAMTDLFRCAAGSMSGKAIALPRCSFGVSLRYADVLSGSAIPRKKPTFAGHVPSFSDRRRNLWINPYPKHRRNA